MAAGAPLDDREKQRLAHLMANGTEDTMEDADRARPARRHGGEVAELERMFDTVVEEVSQHKQALREALEAKSPEATSVKRQLDAALEDLKRIDLLLRTA